MQELQWPEPILISAFVSFTSPSLIELVDLVLALVAVIIVLCFAIERIRQL